MRRVVGLFLLGLVVVVGGSLSAYAKGVETLKGLDKWKVVVEAFRDDATGLTRNRLLTDMTLRLRTYGLNTENTIGAYLYFNVNKIPLDGGTAYVYNTRCEYNQFITLRNGASSTAATWDAPATLGYTSRNEFADTIRSLARDCADDFAAAFMEANPDFTPPRPSD